MSIDAKEYQSSIDFLIGRRKSTENQKQQCEMLWSLVPDFRKKKKDYIAHERKVNGFDRKLHHFDVAINTLKDKLKEISK